MINYPEIGKLEKIEPSETFVESTLINMEDQSVLFTFLWNPANWTYSAQNAFQTKYAMFGKKPHTTYQNSQVGILTLSRLEFRSPCFDRNMNIVKRQLEALRFPLEGKMTPPILSWVTGQRVISPLYLQSLTIEQLDQIDGNSTALGVTLTFIGSDQISL